MSQAEKHHNMYPYLVYFYRHFYHPAFWTSRGHRCLPVSPPVRAFIYIAQFCVPICSSIINSIGFLLLFMARTCSSSWGSRRDHNNPRHGGLRFLLTHQFWFLTSTPHIIRWQTCTPSKKDDQVSGAHNMSDTALGFPKSDCNETAAEWQR